MESSAPMPFQRHFIDWQQPILPAAADLIIERYATADELNLSNLVLVFTGRRASRRMLELLFEKAADKWPAFIPPRMTTFQQFPEMLYPQQHRWADDFTQLLIWKKALSSIPPRELKAALPTIPEDDAVPSWVSLCESLRAQHNELAEDGMEFDEVSKALRAAGNHPEADRWKALRRIQSEYLMQLDELQLWDKQASRLIAVEKEECRADFDVMLIGTVDMSLVVRKMLDQVAGRVTAVVHAPESEADKFDEYGCLIPEEWVNCKLNIPVKDTRVADNPDQQATFLVDEIVGLNGRCAADEIAIGVADEALVPAIMQNLAAAGVTGRWPVEMQLTETRPWRLLNSVVEHLASATDGQPPKFTTFASLVRHPDVGRLVDADVRKALKLKKSSDLDWLTELDRYTSRHLQGSPGILLGRKPARDVVGAIIASVDRLLTSLCSEQAASELSKRSKKVSQQRELFADDQPEVVSQDVQQQLQAMKPLTDWANGILRLLATAYHKVELQAGSRRDRGISACCKAFSDAVELLQNVPAAIMPKCTASQAIQLILRQIGDIAVPPEGDDNAIDLLGWLELAMDDAPVLILTGFNEGFVPESITSDVFLPNSFRTKLGLRDNTRRYARDAYAVTAMMHSRRQLVFISGRRDAKGNPMMPSRLWFAADSDSLPDRVRTFYDEESVATEDVDDHSADVEDLLPALDTANSRTSGFMIPQPTIIPAAPTEISVTSFRDYLYCPYRYFLKRELRLKSVDDETLELDAASFGSLMHDVLNDFGNSDVAHALRPEPIEEFLLKALNSLATKRFGRNRSATIAVQLQMMQDRLSAFAAWQATTASEGWRIMHTEEDLKYEDFKDAKDRDVVLGGRVDRIDQNQTTGQFRVLDYKTSETAEKPEKTHFSKGEWVDLQLPLYRLLVRSLGIEDNLQLGYVHLPGDLASVGASIARWDHAELESAEQTARQVAADIIDLKLDRIAPGHEHRFTELGRVCQDSVIDRSLPWLESWTGR